MTLYSISELCERRFTESGWTGIYTTDIKDLAGALEDVCKLGLEDLSWVEWEVLLVDANADVGTPSPLDAASPPRIRILNNRDEAAKKAAAIHRLVAQDMERPLVPRQEGRVFEEATNAQLRASLRLCGVFPQHEYYDKRGVLIAAYLKAPMVLPNVAQCAHLSGQLRWCDAEIGASTIMTDGDPYEFYPDCLVYGGESPATQVSVSQLPRGVVAAQVLASQQQASQLLPNGAPVGAAPTPIGGGPHSPFGASPSVCSDPCEPCDGSADGTASGQPEGGSAAQGTAGEPSQPPGGPLVQALPADPHSGHTHSGHTPPAYH